MLFGLAAFLGAFLLFLVQPFMGKVLTPLFGGGAGVWITCMVFFQIALMAGYFMAHAASTRLPRKFQARAFGIAALLVAGSLTWTAWSGGAPMLVPGGLGTSDSLHPALRILLLLALCVGPLFVLLSATAPMVQAWYARTATGHSPYRLYAISNLGSLAGLLAYPFLLEPRWTLTAQAWFIVVVFAFFTLLMMGIGRKSTLPSLENHAPAHDEDVMPTRLFDRLRWMALAAAGSALLVSTTQVLTWTVATAPMIWMLPLGAYLLTYIVAFERERTTSLLLMLIFLGLLIATPFLSRPARPLLTLAWGVGLVLSGGLLCHGRLSQLKPEKARLTAFYLAISVGGAMGGAATALLSPLLFHRFYEFHIALAAVSLAAWGSALTMQGIRRSLALLMASISLGTSGALAFSESRKPGEWSRDFYGAHAVLTVQGRLWMMVDGQVNHGMELIQEPRRPIAYYGPDSGVGRAVRVLRSRKAHLRIAVVGLGGGGMAANAMAGDEIVFFEISPEMIRRSGFHPSHFTFITHCPAKVEIVEGDGRARLQEDRRSYDLVMLDAFSGGNIPAHLITTEAVRMYLAHLNDGGLLVFNTSNRMPLYKPLLSNVRDLGAWGLEIHEAALRIPDLPVPIELENHQVIVSRSLEILLTPDLMGPAWILVGPGAGAPSDIARKAWLAGQRSLQNVSPWTDERNSLSDVMFQKR